MGVPYGAQLDQKVARARDELGAWPDLAWLDPVPSAESGFRNKAKLVVGGSVDAPTLGILDAERRGVDLRECGIVADGIRAVLPTLADFVARARLEPYDVPARRGELKHLLVTESPDGELMVRFVLRSTEAVARIRKHLPWLRAALPRLAVASINLQPAHAAIVEGERELPLTDAASLRMRVGGLDLELRPGGFFQTNTAIAAGLYRQASAWLDELAPSTVWDLYCGVGGFALHAAAPGRRVLGVESSAAAVESARATADAAGLDVVFATADATAFAEAAAAHPDAVVVNPPRRGIGARLAGWLEASDVGAVVYSSCNDVTLARDLAAMPSFAPRVARVFDMFPQSTHSEVMVLLERR